jgi:glycerophosphoryl diester phosphodiesterase
MGLFDSLTSKKGKVETAKDKVRSIREPKGSGMRQKMFPALATEIIGHRGASEDAPENTIASLKLGFAQGADGCELDFHSTKDHRLVVIHDGTTKRVAGVDKKVSEQTLDELRALEVGQWGEWKDKGFSEKIPTLDEALATVPEGRRLFLHCYCSQNDIKKLRDLVLRSGTKAEQVVFVALILGPCKEFKAVLPECKAYWLHAYGPSVPSLDELIQKAKAAHIDGLDLDKRFPIDKSFVQKVHLAGLELHVWTVDDAGEALKLIVAGVDSITTNRPGWLLSQVRLSRRR